MKMTINEWDMKRIFVGCGRDYYSMNGLKTLLEYFDEIDENIEFDPIAICCDCTEYGEYGAICSFKDLINDYGYLYSDEEYRDDNLIAISEYDENSYIEALLEKLEEHTTVLCVCNGNYIVFTF